MIYLDASVALAHLFVEQRSPPAAIWSEEITASELLKYEIWNRIHVRGLGRSHAQVVGTLLDRVTLVEMSPKVLARALEPLPVQVRTLDSLHLATIDFLRGQGHTVELVSYDKRMQAAAGAMGIAIYEGP